MKRILVTGGTTFVSRYAADYFVNAGYEVYALNRNTKPQVQGAEALIQEEPFATVKAAVFFSLLSPK